MSITHKIVRFLGALTIALAFGVGFPLGGSHVAMAALGSVTGSVTDGTTSDPLYPATIRVEQYDTGDLVGTFSNFVDGSFLIGVPAGTYRIAASADGYITGWYPGNSTKEDATAVIVPDGGAVSDVNFSLEEGGSITGTVRNQWDGTEQNQVVTVWTADNLESVSWTFTNESDGHGQYVIGDLPYGEYKVSAGGPLPEGVEDPGNRNQNLMRGWWSQSGTVDSAAEADIITVSNPTPIQGIDFQLQEGGQIEGRIVDENWNGLNNATVTIEDYDTGEVVATMVSYNRDGVDPGYYRFGGLSTNISYIVWATAQNRVIRYATDYNSGTYNRNDATEWQVGPSENRWINDLSLPYGGSISGTVFQSDGTTAIPDAVVIVESTTTSGDNWVMVEKTTDASGHYTVPGIPLGEYEVSALATGFAIEFYAATGSVTDPEMSEPVTISPGQVDVTGIDFALDPGGTVSGTVTKTNQQALIEAEVFAIPVDQIGDEHKSPFGATTDASGNYTIIGLPYGDYNIFADGGENAQYVGEWYDDQPTDDTAEVISVTAEAADVTGIDFVLEVGGSITGVVTPNGGDQWLNNVQIIVFDPVTKNKVAEAGTLQDGMTYLVQGIPAGSYIVMAKAQERARVYYQNTIDVNDATLVTVNAPGVTANINFSLPEGGRFNGRVMMPDDPQPLQLSGAKVTAFMLNDLVTSDEEFEDLIFSTYTNDIGEYELDGLPFGDYKIKAQGGEGQAVIPKYWSNYGDAATWEDAGVYTLNNRYGDWIEFWLDPAALATGSVYQGDGVTPIEGANVFAMEEMFYGEGSEWENLSATQTEADGSFELFVPADRQFVVGAQSDGRVRMFFQDTFDPDEAVRFHLMEGEEVGGVNFSLEPAGTISGTIYDADTSQPLEDCVAIAMDESTGVEFKASTEADGTYTIDNLPFGEYTVMAMGLPETATENYAMEWWQETNNWDAATPVVVDASTTDVTGIDFTLEPGGAIEGMIRHEQGWDIDGALVTLYLPDGTPIFHTYSRGWEGYRFNGVPSGTYKISAWYIEPQGYNSTQHVFYDGQDSFETADVIEVTAPNTVSNIDFSLPQANGQISGLIIYSGEMQSGDYEDVVVTARPYGFYKSDEMCYTMSMQEVGTYQFNNIADGDYIVMAFLDVDGNSRPDAGEPYGFFGDPTPVTLESTPENPWPTAPGTTIIITDEAKGIISGEAFLEDSEDHSGITVSAGTYQTTTSADGSYILNAAPGTYTVTISKNGYLAAVSAEVYVVDVISGEPTEMPSAVLLHGDVDGDGSIDVADLVTVAENLGTSGPAGDLTGDGFVDAGDLVPIGRNFGETASLWLEEGSTPSPLPQGNGLASVTLDPSSVTFAPDETTGIDVNLKDALNVFAVDFHLDFDPALVEVQDADTSLDGTQIAPSDELFPFVPGAYYSESGTPLYYYSYSVASGGYFIAASEADNITGEIDYVITLLAPEEKEDTDPVSADSSGADLATVTFLGLDEGEVNVTFDPTPNLTDGLGKLITVDNLAGATLTVQIPPPEISDIVVSNIGDKSFTVSWVTNVSTTGQIDYGTSAGSLTSVAYDDRGETTEDDTHHVTISGLVANTTYYFEVVSGVTTDDNSGSSYSVTTGPSLSFTMPEMVSGKVYKMDGTTPAEGTIVYVQIGTSQVLSGLVDSSGTWGLNIASIRTADFQSYYTHADANNMTIDAQGSGDGSGSQTVTIADAKAGTPEITLIPNYAPTVENVTASQNAGTGTISIEYDVYDQDEDDTSVEVSFAYWNGSAYVTCSTVTSDGTKTVSTTATHYTATWDAKSDFNNKYMTSAKIKVLANDGNVQGVGTGISADFTLDTKGPIDVTCSSPSNASTDVSISPTLTAGTATDQSSPVSYNFVIAKDADFQTGVQESGWLEVNTWVPSPRLQAPEVTYWWKVEAKDSFGNESTSTAFTLTTLAVVPVDAELVDGWNIFGLAVEPTSDYTASSLAAEINDQGGGVTQVFWWNAAAGSWDFYLADIGYGTDFDIEVGYGYHLQNSTAVTWTYWGVPLSADYSATVEPQVTNLADKSFTISWISQDAEQGLVNYGTSPESLTSVAYDDRGETTTDDTHHVSITGLAANTIYYYEVVSGSATYNNSGSPYELTTGPSLAFTMPEMISGETYKTGGVTAAEGTIIYVQIGDSQLLSGLVDSSGTWGLNIAAVRTADFQSYYTHADTDEVSVQAQGAGDGSDSQTETIATAKSGAPAMEVSIAAQLSLVDGWNLIALPVEPAASYTASTAADEINDQDGSVTQVFWWNAAAGGWDFYLADIGYGTDFSIELGEGYLLQSTTASTWTIPGS